MLRIFLLMALLFFPNTLFASDFLEFNWGDTKETIKNEVKEELDKDEDNPDKLVYNGSFFSENSQFTYIFNKYNQLIQGEIRVFCYRNEKCLSSLQPMYKKVKEKLTDKYGKAKENKAQSNYESNKWETTRSNIELSFLKDGLLTIEYVDATMRDLSEEQEKKALEKL